jgi:hypothetical protein
VPEGCTEAELRIELGKGVARWARGLAAVS